MCGILDELRLERESSKRREGSTALTSGKGGKDTYLLADTSDFAAQSEFLDVFFH